MKHTKFGLTAFSLRCIAMGLMLLDHMWATVVPGNDWMNYLGRLAFPIFAFQIAEGYRHTRNFRRYCQRLLIFALVSEIPFNLMVSGSPVYPFHQNVLFTFLLGLAAIHTLDGLRRDDALRPRLTAIGKLFGILLAAVLGFPDYGMLGVLTVVMFYLLRDVPHVKLCQFLAMLLIHGFGYDGQTIPLLGGAVQFPVQAFAVFALIPIWLYNGRRGPGGKWVQLAFYAFYPAHMLILALL